MARIDWSVLKRTTRFSPDLAGLFRRGRSGRVCWPVRDGRCRPTEPHARAAPHRAGRTRTGRDPQLRFRHQPDPELSILLRSTSGMSPRDSCRLFFPALSNSTPSWVSCPTWPKPGRSARTA